MNEVIDFINNFKKLNLVQIEESFLYGNCYWFARILVDRFTFYDYWKTHSASIMYNFIDNHFFAKIDNRYYDISGEIFPKEGEFDYWNIYAKLDEFVTQEIIKDSIQLIQER